MDTLPVVTGLQIVWLFVKSNMAEHFNPWRSSNYFNNAVGKCASLSIIKWQKNKCFLNFCLQWHSYIMFLYYVHNGGARILHSDLFTLLVGAWLHVSIEILFAEWCTWHCSRHNLIKSISKVTCWAKLANDRPCIFVSYSEWMFFFQ